MTDVSYFWQWSFSIIKVRESYNERGNLWNFLYAAAAAADLSQFTTCDLHMCKWSLLQFNSCKKKIKIEKKNEKIARFKWINQQRVSYKWECNAFLHLKN